MKKLLLFLCIILTLSLHVFAQESLANETIGDTITWAIENDGTLRISGTGDIPNYTKTTTAPWYLQRELITSIVVEEGITGIGDYAFYNIAKATTINLADSVYHLGQFFIRDTGITEIALNTAKEAEPFAFSTTPNLKTIIFGEAVKNFKGNIFGAGEYSYTIKAPTDSYVDHYARHYSEKYTTSAVQLTFESTGNAVAPVQHFSFAGDNVFYVIYANSASNWSVEVTGGSRMKNFPYISKKYEGQLTPMYDIAEYTDNERKIMTIKVYDGVETIGNYAFYKCNKAHTLIIPDNITSIGAGAFWACAKLTTINIPETVTKIGRNAFNGCANLTTVTIPDSVTEIGQNIFIKCNTANLTVTTNNKLVIETLREQHSDVTINTTIEEEKPLSVSEVFNAELDSVVTVEGYYVGVASEGANADKEMLIKDINGNEIIAVRNVPYGAFPNYNYQKGDRLSFEATVKLDGTEYTPNKIYLDFSENNGDIDSTIISSGNEITYDLSDAVEIKSWQDMQSVFKVGDLKEYTYVKIDGEFYINYYEGTYRLHMNPSAIAVAYIKPDGVHAIGLATSAMDKNLGSKWQNSIARNIVTTSPGTRVVKTIYAIYTGADKYNFQLTLLEKDWIMDYEYDKNDIVKEIAYAYYRKGGQIQYCQSRRSFTASPEQATPQRMMYLDCSSFVNACYFEGFGQYVLPEFKNPTTANYNDYAKNNQSNPDVIGYWENKNYTTEEEKEALLKSIQESLQVGDIIVYRHGKTSSTSGHTYIYVGNDTFLHSYGGASYVINSNDPSKSYDSNSAEVNGMIGTITMSNLMNKNHARYLFKATESDTVNSFCHLRPFARGGFEATSESKNRMFIAGVVSAKTSSILENSAVYTGDTITYTVTMKNTNSHDLNTIRVTDTLPAGTEFVSGDFTASGTSLDWSGKLPASSTVTLSYTVRVTANEAGTKIVSNATKVSGVSLGNIIHTVSGYNKTHTALIAEASNDFINSESSFFNPITFVNKLYSNALGIQIFNQSSVSAILDEVIDTENLTCRTDTKLSKILVPNLFGGTSIRAGYRTIPDNDRTRIISEAELSIGDIILADWSGGSIVYVYIGNSKLLTLKDSVPSTLTIGQNIFGEEADNILISLLGYNRFAVLRPSMSSTKPTFDIESIEIATPPTKTSYNHGEAFDKTGMKVMAKLSNGNETEITSYNVTPEILLHPTENVTVEFAGFTETVAVETKLEIVSVGVDEAHASEDGVFVKIEGYFVGVADEGQGTDSFEEMLLKDINSDTLISVRGIPYGAFPNYGYKKGDKVSFMATVMTDNTTNTSGKKYLEFSDTNGDINSTIVSSGNTVTYDLDNVVTVSTWSQMKSLFKIGTIKEYTYVKFTGTFYLNYYATTKIYRIHNNSSCNSLATMKPDGSRCAGFRDDIAKANLGSGWTSLLFSGNASGYPGLKVSDKSFIAVFTGADGYNFQLTILESDWITSN